MVLIVRTEEWEETGRSLGLADQWATTLKKKKKIKVDGS